ncbi:MAG: TSUP family transporter [Verrucomicrobiota bacterium]
MNRTLVLAANFPIPKANAIKVLSIGLATLLSVIIFGFKGQIAWAYAIPVSIGSIIGSLIAVKLVMGAKAGKWVYALILITLLTEILRIGSGMLH